MYLHLHLDVDLDFLWINTGRSCCQHNSCGSGQSDFFCDIPVWLVFLFTDEIPLLSKMKQSRPISF